MLLRFIYSFLLILIAPIFLFSLYKSKSNKPKFGKRWKEHFGSTPALNNPKDQPIWIHAVSVGEVLAVTPLIKKIKQQNPTLDIVITTTTSTGAAEANKLGELVEHRYMPLDFAFAVRGFINSIKPKALFIMETELWPNTLYCCQQNNISVTVINARLSARSAARYKKFPFVFNLLLKNINFILAQTKQDAQRFINLGLTTQQLSITGSIKFDINVTDQQLEQALHLREYIGKDREVWIAASTHKDEDEQLIEAHKQLLTSKPDALMILVPRHPERFQSVKELVKSYGLSVVTRSSKKPVQIDTKVYLGDSMGEIGGHNLLEAAALKKPILNGPSYFNFKEITEQLINLGACKICQNSNEIADNLNRLFNDNKMRNEQGKLAFEFVKNNKGALSKTSKAIAYIVNNIPSSN